MGPLQCCTLGCHHHSTPHFPRGMRQATRFPCHHRTRRTYVDRGVGLRLQARRILGPSPIDSLALSSEDLEDTDLSALFSVLVDRCPQDLIKALSLESSEVAIDGLDLVSRYLNENQVLESLYLADNQATSPTHSKSRNDMEAFVSAINHSRIKSLSLAFNGALLDQFLSSLRFYYPPSRYLRNINLSDIDYTLDELSVHSAALHLLPLSRVLMFYTYRQSPPKPDPYISSCNPLCEEPDISHHQSACMPISHACSTLMVSPSWQSLPIELQLQILQYVAPILSFTQVTRVVNYAANPNTLCRDDKTMQQWLDVFRCSSN